MASCCDYILSFIARHVDCSNRRISSGTFYIYAFLTLTEYGIEKIRNRLPAANLRQKYFFYSVERRAKSYS